MDVPEEKYKKTIAQYRNLYTNLINQYPIPVSLNNMGSHRNLKYILNKQLLTSNYPYYNNIYEQALEQIKISLTDQNLQNRYLQFRLASALPFIYRIKLIETCENEITNAVLSVSKRQNQIMGNPYGYQAAADLSTFLLSVFELTVQNQEFYFDVNQRIITIFSRYFQSCLQTDKNNFRNSCQIIRNIFLTFGYNKNARNQTVENKLISKLISIFIPYSSFVNKQQISMSSSNIVSQFNDKSANNLKFQTMIMRARQFEVRIRARIYYGFCCLLGYLPSIDYEIINILTKEIFLILQNISQCDVNLECFSCLSALMSQPQFYSSHSDIFKRWCSVIYQIAYKKEYLQYYILLLELTNNKEIKLPAYEIYNYSIYCLQLTTNIQQQYTRFIIYIKSCRNLIQISRKSYRINSQCNFLLNIFQYSWFIDQINQQSDLFKSQFLIGLLHSHQESKVKACQEEIKDLMDICHRLIDWKCTSKEETHIPTLKLAFDMYLNFLTKACESLNNNIEINIIELINRCNQPSIYFVFKFKLIAALLNLPWYQQNYKYLQNAKLNFQFIENQIRVVMMPKNPKPIFFYEYSLTYDGQIQSRKQIEYIKIIMKLLNQISKIHQNYLNEIQTIQIDYNKYLSQLQERQDSNRQLINCLQTLEADYYLNQCQRYFLLATMENNTFNGKNLNAETNLEDIIMYSHYESIQSEEEINIFGPMSPIQLMVKLKAHPSYSSVYIHVKKNQWVQVQGDLKLIVSSGIQKKQIPFQSSILQIKVDRLGSLHFEVWKGHQNNQLLGSGSYKIYRRLKWKRYDHLSIIDGIKTKAYFKQIDKEKAKSSRQTFLSFYYGQPIMIHILKEQNQVIFGVSSKDICNQLRQNLMSFLSQLAHGSAQII